MLSGCNRCRPRWDLRTKDYRCCVSQAPARSRFQGFPAAVNTISPASPLCMVEGKGFSYSFFLSACLAMNFCRTAPFGFLAGCWTLLRRLGKTVPIDEREQISPRTLAGLPEERFVSLVFRTGPEHSPDKTLS